MGWPNYIIIQKLNLIVEISRHTNELHDYQKEALNYLTSEDRLYDTDEEQDIGDISVRNLSVKNISLLYNIYEQANKISEMTSDEFFLYWLESKNLKYEIKSEFELSSDKIEQYKLEGYTILRIFETEN